MKHLIWLDDERTVPKNLQWFSEIIVCKTYKQAVNQLNALLEFPHGKIYISFDHDLGGEKTGYDFAKYIVANDIHIEGFECHSFNPVGRKNIEDLMTHYGYQLGIK